MATLFQLTSIDQTEGLPDGWYFVPDYGRLWYISKVNEWVIDEPGTQGKSGVRIVRPSHFLTPLPATIPLTKEIEEKEFAEWTSSSDAGWTYLPSKKLWYNEEQEEKITPKTTDDLFKLFIATKNK